MIAENEREALALTWFQDTGWEFRHGPVIAPGRVTLRRRWHEQ